MVKRRVDWKIYILIGLVTFIFFFSGIFAGVLISKTKIDVLSSQVDQFSSSMKETETMMLFLSIYGEKACDMIYEQMNKLSEESENIGKDVAFLETTKKIDDPYYTTLKKNYMSVMLMHWLYNEKAKADCKTNSTTILFFYSNLYCKSCKDEGTVLTYLKQKYPENIMLFSFDTDLEITMIKHLGKLYGFEAREDPVIIIEGKKYEKFMNREEIESVLCELNEKMC